MIVALVATCLAQEATNTTPTTTDRIAELTLSRVDNAGTWTVRDGRTHEVDARTWALLTGDSVVLEKIAATQRRTGIFGLGLAVGGGAVALSSLIPLLTMEESLSENESTPGFDDVGVRNDIRVATAFSLIGTGVILAGTGFAARAISHDRALDLSLHLDAAAADAAIVAYNRRLSETLTVEVVARPPTEPAEDLDLEPAVEGASTAPAAPAPAAPTAAPAAPTAAPTGTATPAPTAAPAAPATGTGGK
jgi:hypothetical protein